MAGRRLLVGHVLDQAGRRPGGAEAQEVSLASLRSGIGVIAPRGRWARRPSEAGTQQVASLSPLLASQAN